MLDGGLVTGNLVEICGFSRSGKTQLVNTIALNAASEPQKIGTFYLDAKHDFSGMRLYNILTSRNNGSNKNCGEIMERVKVARIYDVTELIRVLRDLLRNIDKYSHFKILIVDSMPSLWFLFQGDDFRQGNMISIHYLSSASYLSDEFYFRNGLPYTGYSNVAKIGREP